MIAGSPTRSLAKVAPSWAALISLVLVVVMEIVSSLFIPFFIQVKFDGIEADDDALRAALIASHVIALLYLGVYKYFLTALRADRCGHSSSLLKQTKYRSIGACAPQKGYKSNLT